MKKIFCFKYPLFPTIKGLQLVPVISIISSASEGNYTIFLMKDKQKIVVSCPLKEVEEKLVEHSFSGCTIPISST